MTTRNEVRDAINFALIAKEHGNAYTMADAYMRLRALSRRLHRYDEDECNGVMADGAYEKATASVYKSLIKVLEPFKISFYHQTDPRGCSLYIERESYRILTAENYTNGLPIA